MSKWYEAGFTPAMLESLVSAPEAGPLGYLRAFEFNRVLTDDEQRVLRDACMKHYNVKPPSPQLLVSSLPATAHKPFVTGEGITVIGPLLR